VDSPQPTPEREMLNEIVTRLDALEKEATASKEFRVAVVGAIRAFLVVFGIRWLPDQPRTGPDPAEREP
jgi:hypothetical protein